MTFPDTENEIPWDRYNALANQLDEAMARDGVKHQPADVLMACLIVISQILRAAPSETIFAQLLESINANLSTMLDAVVRSRHGETGETRH